MKENELIVKLFKDLFEGSPWIDVNIIDTLKGISAEDASRKLPGRNSIWEIVHHITLWRLNVLERIQDRVIDTPGHNYFEPVSDFSESAWQRKLEDLKASQEKWIAYLSGMRDDTFLKIYPVNNMNYYEHIHGILQHDAYHLGQIRLLSKNSQQ